MKNSHQKYDVVVVGAGNAALCAALSAREQNAKVLVLEAAPAEFRGGNSYFTDGAIRFAYKDLDDLRKILPEMTDDEANSVDVGSYSECNYIEDIMRVTEGKADPELVRLLVENSRATIQWMHDRGVSFALSYKNQSFESNERYHFWGGLIIQCQKKGIGLVDKLFEKAEEIGVDIWYEARGQALIQNSEGAIVGLKIEREEITTIETKTIVLACGGFEANTRMRTSNLGPQWQHALVRGTPYNLGDGIRMAIEAGAQPYGDWGGCHSIATDINAPLVGDFSKPGDIYKKHCYPLGIMVNKRGERFVDEGADFRNYTYAKYGREILKQPDRIAYQIFDDRVRHLLREEYQIREATRIEASTLEALADAIEIDKQNFLATLKNYNNAVRDKEYNPYIKDGKGTEGIFPPKSNWALKIDRPPFLAFPVTCGITFTFGGLKVNSRTQVLDSQNRPLPGLYAAGELVGGLFYHNYPGGSGLMAGATFGKIAGMQAACFAGELSVV